MLRKGRNAGLQVPKIPFRMNHIFSCPGEKDGAWYAL
jgi:hypothetical protein